MPACSKVHREERDVRAYVSAAEGLAELDAVDDGEAVLVADVEVIEPEVPMALADVSLLAAAVSLTLRAIASTLPHAAVASSERTRAWKSARSMAALSTCSRVSVPDERR